MMDGNYLLILLQDFKKYSTLAINAMALATFPNDEVARTRLLGRLLPQVMEFISSAATQSIEVEEDLARQRQAKYDGCLQRLVELEKERG
jgi:hypothetical protein